jgi:uncharacterized protein
VVIAMPEEVDSLIESLLDGSHAPIWGGVLHDYAIRAITSMRQLAENPFAPECLTLYLHNQCNLACAYCYTNPVYHPSQHLDPHIIRAGAQLVAKNCQQKGLPFTAVFHGGGEPSLFQDEVNEALGIIEEIAKKYALPIFRYIATNGVMPEAKVRWLASRFDLIGLSCDGTPDIQNRQRPTHGGGGSSATLEKTAHLLNRMGKPFHVRTTITHDIMRDQPAIADYLCKTLSPQEIHFEPVYYGGKTDVHSALVVDEIQTFVDHFFEAQGVARHYRIPLTCSSSRLNDIHGAYCHVFRQVLNLVPDGIATACFKLTRADDIQQMGLGIGTFEPESGFELDRAHITHLRHQLSTLPDVCATCFNRFHCTRACPDTCLIAPNANPAHTFRCGIQKALAYRTIHTIADDLWQKTVNAGGLINGIIL